MALEGTIKDFGLPDIFQLIGLQRKTGLLTLKHDQDQVTVYFENGRYDPTLPLAFRIARLFAQPIESIFDDGASS